MSASRSFESRRPPASSEAARKRMVSQRRADTKPERIVREVLRELGVHYRLHNPRLPGSPDFSNQRGGWALFVHGCFWHQHPGCHRATVPAKNRAWWLEKFARTQERDRQNLRDLVKLGLRIAVVWECQTRDREALAGRLRGLVAE